MLQIEQANTILYCEKWQETVAFYRDTLRLPVVVSKDWFVEFRLTDKSYVSIADTRRATITSSHGAGVTLTWRVADVRRSRDFLTALGVSVTPLKQRWGATVAYLYDPEGNRIELWQTKTSSQ